MKQVTAGTLLWIAASGLALASTVSGTVVVDGAELYIVDGEKSVRVIGDSNDASTFTGRLAFLEGEQVTIRGPLRSEALGKAIVPKIWANPVFLRLTATVVDPGPYRSPSQVRIRGMEVPATGLVTQHTPENTQFEAFVFRDAEETIVRVHLARARVEGGFVREVVSKHHWGAIPLPPGNPTVLWNYWSHRADVEDEKGRPQRSRVKTKKLSFVQGDGPEPEEAPAQLPEPGAVPVGGITGAFSEDDPRQD